MKISICIPCYNEKDNLEAIYQSITEEMCQEKYDYEIIFADNASKDESRVVLRKLAERDKHVKVILNLSNYGPKRSNYNGIYRSTGDAMITLACDFQDPISMIHILLRKWEEGNKVVFGQKVLSKENPFKRGLRTLYYRIIQVFSNVKHNEHVSSLFLLDRSVIDTLKTINDFDLDIHHLLEELGYPIMLVPYVQEKRRAGKSSYNMLRYLDFAIVELINTSYVPLRITTILGVCMSICSFLLGVSYLVYKLMFWYTFDAGMAPIVIGLFFLGSVQLMFMGIIGEYIGVVLRKITNRPLVLEEEIINFDNQKENIK